MEHDNGKSDQPSSNVEAVPVDASSQFEEQWARIQKVDLEYLHQKTSECIANRRAPYHLYKDRTRHQVLQAFPQERKVGVVPNGLSSAPRSELATRVLAQRNHASYCRKPLQCAKAFSLQAPSQSTPVLAAEKDAGASVFFDDERFDASDVVFINGEPQQVAKGYQSKHLFYALNPETAAIRDAVVAAVSHPVGSFKAVPSPGDVRQSTKRSLPRTSTTAQAAMRRREYPRPCEVPKEQGTPPSVSSERYRDYISSAGRRYRVFRIPEERVPPTEADQNAEGFFLPQQNSMAAVDPPKREKSHKAVENRGAINGRRKVDQGRVAAHNRNNRWRAVKSDRLLSPAQKERTPETYKQQGAYENMRRKHNNRRGFDGALHQNKETSKYTHGGCGRSMSSTSLPENASPELSASLSLSSPRGLLEDIMEMDSGDDDCAPISAVYERRRRGHGHDDGLRGDGAECRLPPIEGVHGSHHAPTSPHHRDSRVHGKLRRMLHRHQRRRARKTNVRRVVPSDSEEFSSSLCLSAIRVWSSASNSFEETNIMSDSLPTERSQRNLTDQRQTQKGTRQCGRGRSAPPHVSASDGDQESFDRTSGSSRDKGSEWEGTDSTFSSLLSPASLSHSQLDPDSRTEQLGRGWPNSRQRDRCSTRSPLPASRKEGRSALGDFPAKPRQEPDKDNKRVTRRPMSPPSSSSGLSRDKLRAAGAPHDSQERTRDAFALHSWSDSLTHLPIAHAILSTHPLGKLPPLGVLPLNTHYATSAPTPVTQKPPPEQTPNGAQSYSSPAALSTPRLQLTAGMEGIQFHDAVGATQGACQGMLMLPLQVTYLSDSATPPVASSGPVHATVQMDDIPKWSTSPKRQSDRTEGAVPPPIAGPVDLDQITEHVWRAIQSRLSGKNSAHDTELRSSRGTKESRGEGATALHGREQAEEMVVAEAAKRAAQVEALYVRAEQLSLGSLTDSMRDALEQVTLSMERGDNADGPTLSAALKHRPSRKSSNSPGASGAPSLNNTPVHPVAEDNAALWSHAGSGASGKKSDRDTATAVDPSHAVFFPEQAVNVATLQRLIQELRRQRQKHEAGVRIQKQRAEAEAKEREALQQRQLQRQQLYTQEINELFASERQSRDSVHRGEGGAWGELLATAVSARNEAFRMSLCDEELSGRTHIIAAEKEKANDLWELAVHLFQASAEDAEAREKERRQQQEEAAAAAAAALQEAQDAEARRIEADGVAAISRKERYDSGRHRSSDGKVSPDLPRRVMSHVIPGQLLDITGGKPIEKGGKIRLVGDPHVAAVEAHARERRRADHLRREKLASASPSLQRATKRSASSGGRLSTPRSQAVNLGVYGQAIGVPRPWSRSPLRNGLLSASPEVSVPVDWPSHSPEGFLGGLSIEYDAADLVLQAHGQ
ncbi:hypothetical protein JKF63_07039 [Porcisia hertigi]|uniref:Uncharacterized protein n=1 Tax=Porcisia hertigi TaxID=2761500 RepID=A0A836LJ15_9TRYP|nr:hypothetical protein JKF63_07039 [Porcisia hertigi]